MNDDTIVVTAEPGDEFEDIDETTDSSQADATDDPEYLTLSKRSSMDEADLAERITWVAQRKSDRPLITATYPQISPSTNHRALPGATYVAQVPLAKDVPGSEIMTLE
jgi:hypothetical protein